MRIQSQLVSQEQLRRSKLTAVRRPRARRPKKSSASTSAKAIIPLLNRIDHVAMLRSRYGAARIIPAIITDGSERTAPGPIVHRSPFARSSISSIGRTLMQSTLEGLQKLGFTCQFVDDEQTLHWSKLVFLAPLALVTTAAEKTTGEIAADVTWKQQLEFCVREACTAAHAAMPCLADHRSLRIATEFQFFGGMRWQ
jgi:2-dehydropantoate 2-reductase